MIIDKLISPAVLLPLAGYSVATHTVGEVMDFGVARNLGSLAMPERPGWDINVRGATSGGAATLALSLVTSAAANLSDPVTLFTSGTITLANLAKFDRWVQVEDTDSWLRYVAWRAVVGTAVFTGGTLSIEYSAMKRNWRAYPAQGNT